MPRIDRRAPTLFPAGRPARPGGPSRGRGAVPRGRVDLLDLFERQPDLAQFAQRLVARCSAQTLARDPDPATLTAAELAALLASMPPRDRASLDPKRLKELREAMADGAAPSPDAVDAGTPALLGARELELCGPRAAGEYGYSGAVFESGDRRVLVYARGSEAGEESHLVAGSSGRPRTLSIPGCPAPYRFGGDAVRIGGRDYLYFAASAGPGAPVSFFRSEFANGRFRTAEKLSVPADRCGVFCVPHFHALPDGRVAFTYRTEERQQCLRLSKDGCRFGGVRRVTFERSRPSAAAFRAGPLVFAHQKGWNGGRMQAYVQLSSDDGARWSRPVKLTALSSNVHDPHLVCRRDGGVDAYYAVGFGGGFSLYRRQVFADGRLGPEQRLTDPRRTGELIGPQATRAADGRLFVSAALCTRRADLTLSGTACALFELAADAP